MFYRNKKQETTENASTPEHPTVFLLFNSHIFARYGGRNSCTNGRSAKSKRSVCRPSFGAFKRLCGPRRNQTQTHDTTDRPQHTVRPNPSPTVPSTSIPERLKTSRRPHQRYENDRCLLYINGNRPWARQHRQYHEPVKPRYFDSNSVRPLPQVIKFIGST
ncbi:hypothetical protein AAG570_008056 [Ranatra chinensis]|uniref:Uncharacterized protein n=1 Tax=Ranatra chinensis TaxID=642074 RepID=A0ABD0XTT8_9HEMI